MELDIIQTKTTWNDAATSINSNYAKIKDKLDRIESDVGVTNIPDSSVTTTKIANNAVTKDKLSDDVLEQIESDAGYLFQLKSSTATVSETTEATEEEQSIITYSRSTIYGNTQ